MASFQVLGHPFLILPQIFITKFSFILGEYLIMAYLVE